MSSSSNSQQQQQDPHKDSWYPYSNGTKHFNGNIAMIIIFIFCALVCALAINTAIRFILRLSRSASTNNNNNTGTSASATQQQQQQQQHDDDDYDNKPSMVLPTLVFSSGTKMKLAGVLGAGADAAAECAICLSEFVQGEGVRILPKCKHGFHVKCIEGWLSAHVSCPTCRTTYLPSSPPPPPHNYNYTNNYDVESQSSPPNPCVPLPPLSAASEPPLQRPMRVSE